MTEIIRVDIYNRDVVIHIGKLKPLRKYLNKFLPKETIADVCSSLENTTLGKTIEIESSGIVVYMPEYKGTPKELGILTHELFHAAYMILTKAGISCTDFSDEAYAYLIQFLVEKTTCLLSASQQRLSLDACQHKPS